MRAILSRPSTWFFLLAGAAFVTNASYGWLGVPELVMGDLPAVALVTAAYGAAWFVFELAARSRGRLWLGWVSFGLQALSVGLAVLGAALWFQTRDVEAVAPATSDVPAALLGAAALMIAGYVGAVALLPILPAAALAVLLPRRVQQA